MPNTIALRKAYSTMLDEVYKLASLTAVLDGPNELVREGANANEILIPKMTIVKISTASFRFVAISCHTANPTTMMVEGEERPSKFPEYTKEPV